MLYREAKLEEFKAIFWDNMDLEDKREIEEFKKDIVEIIRKIDSGVFPPFPTIDRSRAVRHV